MKGASVGTPPTIKYNITQESGSIPLAYSEQLLNEWRKDKKAIIMCFGGPERGYLVNKVGIPAANVIDLLAVIRWRLGFNGGGVPPQSFKGKVSLGAGALCYAFNMPDYQHSAAADCISIQHLASEILCGMNAC